jgi:hypothetical protein
MGASALVGFGLSRAAGRQYKALTAKVGISKDVAAHPALPSAGGALLSLGIYALLKVSRRNGMSYSGSNLDRAVAKAKKEIINAIGMEFYHGDVALDQIIERIAVSVDNYNTQLQRTSDEVPLDAIANDMTAKIVNVAREIAESRGYGRAKMESIFRDLIVRTTIELLKREVIEQSEINDFYYYVCAETGLEKGQITGTKREMIGDYHILKRIGGGGMKTVYLAYNPAEGKPVTIHFPKIDPTNERSFRRFVREASLLERAHHLAVKHQKECVMGFYGKSWRLVGSDDIDALRELYSQEKFYYVAEFIDGIDLADLVNIVNRENGQSVLWSLAIFRDVIEAFKFLHGENMIHRDLKPGNVMLTKDGVVKVIDLGLGKEKGVDQTVTVEASTIGTLNFMPPEAGEGASNVSWPGDIYSLGIMLYVMLTGKTPRSIGSLMDFHRYTRSAEEALPELDSLSFAGLSPKNHEILVALLRGITQKRVRERLIDHDGIIKRVDAILANDFGKRG